MFGKFFTNSQENIHGEVGFLKDVENAVYNFPKNGLYRHAKASFYSAKKKPLKKILSMQQEEWDASKNEVAAFKEVLPL